MKITRKTKTKTKKKKELTRDMKYFYIFLYTNKLIETTYKNSR